MGPIIIIMVILAGYFVLSLVKSLVASDIGWVNPDNKTLFGPLRKWANPINFRSIRVKKAILNNTPIVEIRVDNI